MRPLLRHSFLRRDGFMLAPLLYMLALAGIGAAVMFSGYSQILRSNAEMTAVNAARSQLQAAGQTLSASSVLDATTSSIVQPPTVYSASTVAGTADAPRLPTNYANAGNTGTPHDVGVIDVSSGVKQLDPWGKYYIYCRWENPVSTPSAPSLMVISAGPDGQLDTKCGDTVAQGDDRIITSTVAETINRANVWQVSSSSQVKFGLDSNAVRVNQDGSLLAASLLVTEPLAGVATPIILKNKSGTTVFSVSNTGAVSAGTYAANSGTFNSLSVTGTAGIGALNVSGGATIGTTLGVTGATNLTGALAANGGVATTTLNTSGLATLNSLSAGAAGLGNTQVTGTFGATGNFNIATNKFTVDSGTGNTLVAGSLSAGATTLTSLSLTTPLSLASGGTGATSAAGARTALGLGTMATQDASAVAITGGTITGTTITGNVNGNTSGSAGSVPATGITGCCVAITAGGTGAADAASARANLGTNNASNLTTGTVSVLLFPASGVTAGTYNSVTVDGYGRVTAGANTTASQWTTTGSDITYTGGNVGIGTTAAPERLSVNGNVLIEGAAGTTRNLFYSTGTSKRWSVNANATAEGGSNAGSDYVISSYKDDGTALANVFSITRSTSAAAFAGNVSAPTFTGTLIGNVSGTTSGNISLADGSASAPGLYFTNDTNTGIYRPTTDVFGISAGGNDVARFVGGTSNVNYFSIGSSIATAPITISAAGTDTDIPINISGKGAGAINLVSGTGPINLFSNGRAALTASNASGSAVNYLNVAGSTTTNAVGINALGTDTNIAISVTPKGVGAINLGNNQSNYLTVAGASPANSPIIAAAGSDTNVGISLMPKGTGGVGIGTTNATTYPLWLYAPNSGTSPFVGFALTGAQSVANTNSYVGEYMNPTYTAASGNTLSGFIGGQFTPQNTNTGTVTTMYGLLTNPQNTAGGTVGDMYGIMGVPQKSGAGSVTNMYSLYGRCENTNVTGAVTNCYALYLDAPTGTGTITNKYGVFQGDSGSKNYFNGNVGIGSSSPTVKLDVTGAAAFSGNTTVGGILGVTGAATFSSTITGATGVGIGTTSVATTALLDIVSTTKGFLPPRLTTVQRDAIVSPATGLLIYNTNTNLVNVYNGTAWVVTGNDGTTAFSFPAGTVTSPGLYVTGDSDTGFYQSTVNNLSVTTGGTEVVRFLNTASAVNYMTIAAGVTGTPGAVTIGAAGSDTDINVALTPKGAGVVKANAPVNVVAASTAVSAPWMSGTQTWNSSGVTFTGIKENITDTASAAASMLIDLQVGSVSKFSVNKAGNGAFAGTVAASNLSGTNTGDQTITLTGDVTGSGTGSFAATIGAGKVTIPKIGATGTADATTVLRGDGTWASISSISSTSFPAGTVTSPGWAVTTDTDTGLYSPTTNTLSITSGGIESMRFNTVASGVNFLTATPGAAGTPGVVTLGAAGASTDVNIAITPKGAGILSVSANVSAPLMHLTGIAGGQGANGSAGSASGSSGQVQYNSAGSFTGAAGLIYATSGTILQTIAQSATDVAFVVKGAASQSGDLAEFMNSSSAVLSRVDAAGNFVAPTSGYVNFGTTSGTSGYGFRDNAGTLQYKNSAGSWANFSGGSTFAAGLVGAPGWAVTGDTDTGLWAPAANTLSISAGGVEALRLNTAASAVNYISLTPGATTSDAIIGVDGSDTNIGISLTPKGTGGINIRGSASNQLLIFASGATAINAIASNGTAVQGLANASSGVIYGGFFQTDSTSGTGVYGNARAATGLVIGGKFASASDSGYGVQAMATSTTGNAMGGYFSSSSNSGTALYAQAGNAGAKGLVVAAWTVSPTADLAQFLNSSSAVASRIDVNGYFVQAASGYYNFGATAGTSGYGFRDNAGTVQYKNSGGSWANLGTITAGADTRVIYNSGGTLTGSANFAYTGGVLTLYGSGSQVIYANNDTGDGIAGIASAATGFTNGVSGQASSTTGAGVRGYGSSTTGANYGGYFQSNSAGGIALYALAGNATTKPLVVQGATSQTGDLAEFQNASGTALTVVNASGSVGIGTNAPTVKLDVVGAIVSRSNNAGASTAIDWSLANVQYTSASCGAFTFTNMADGGSYTLAIQGTTAGTCSFSQSGLTFKLPAGHGATTASTQTLYSFLRAGTTVYVTWIKGY